MIIRRIGTWVVLPILFVLGLSMVARLSKAADRSSSNPASFVTP